MADGACTEKVAVLELCRIERELIRMVFAALPRLLASE